MPPSVVSRPDYNLPLTIQHVVRDYVYSEFTRKYCLEKYIEEEPNPEEVTLSLIKKVNDALDENYKSAPEDWTREKEEYSEFKERTGNKSSKKGILDAKEHLRRRAITFADSDKFELDPQYYYRIPEIWRD